MSAVLLGFFRGVFWGVFCCFGGFFVWFFFCFVFWGFFFAFLNEYRSVILFSSWQYLDQKSYNVFIHSSERIINSQNISYQYEIISKITLKWLTFDIWLNSVSPGYSLHKIWDRVTVTHLFNWVYLSFGYAAWK